MSTRIPTPIVQPPEAPAPSAERFLLLIADKLAATERVFQEHLTSDVPFIQDAGEYIFSAGGKRMRPALLLLCSQLLGRDNDEDVTYAAVVELIHTATLIHDDIIDNASLRRGRKTINRVWDNHLTVLLGDWLYTLSMEMALSHDNLEVVRALCRATLRMVEGELLALDRLGAIDLTHDEYFAIIDRKTANLFAASCHIPSLIQPVDAAAGKALRAYGSYLGNCFQLVDDLLDFTALEQEVGKPVLSDLKEGKLTLPLILALPRIDARQRTWIANVLEDRSFERSSQEEILEIVHAEGTLEEVGAMADTFADKARQELAIFPASNAREALEAATDFVLNRRS